MLFTTIAFSKEVPSLSEVLIALVELQEVKTIKNNTKANFEIGSIELTLYCLR